MSSAEFTKMPVSWHNNEVLVLLFCFIERLMY
jgi:hypothetical protein